MLYRLKIVRRQTVPSGMIERERHIHLEVILAVIQKVLERIQLKLRHRHRIKALMEISHMEVRILLIEKYRIDIYQYHFRLMLFNSISHYPVIDRDRLSVVRQIIGCDPLCLPHLEWQKPHKRMAAPQDINVIEGRVIVEVGDLGISGFIACYIGGTHQEKPRKYERQYDR